MTAKEIAELRVKVERYRTTCISMDHEIVQTLGKALGGYPWFKDDQKNFPGATEADGILGPDTAEVAADIAAERIKSLRQEVTELRADFTKSQAKAEVVPELVEALQVTVGRTYHEASLVISPNELLQMPVRWADYLKARAALAKTGVKT